MLKRFSHQIVAGCDEAGRGCLAGPVFAAAVILPTDYRHEMLNDSKVLNSKQRDVLRIDIEKKALSWSVASIGSEKIDEINILNASILAMHRALDKLTMIADIVIVDGNRFKKYREIPHQCIIKGDGIYLSIAAASILAKTHRDEYMEGLSRNHPEFSWDSNKGYPTQVHRNAIAHFGPTIHHRKSFRLLPEARQQKLFRNL